MAAAVEQNLETLMEGARADIGLLFRDHHQRVLRAAYRITGSMTDAEDIAQLVFLRFMQSEASRELMAKPESYFFRAAINASLDVLRKRARENALPLDEALPETADASPEHRCQALELRNWLRRALTDLDPRAAGMFVLRYVEECDLGQIAQIFHTSRAVVAVTLHRTRTKLKESLRIRRGER